VCESRPIRRASAAQKKVEPSIQRESYYRHLSPRIRLCQAAYGRSAAAQLRHGNPSQCLGKHRNELFYFGTEFKSGLTARRAYRDLAGLFDTLPSPGHRMTSTSKKVETVRELRAGTRLCLPARIFAEGSAPASNTTTFSAFPRGHI
jgi:hypothetical protein